MTDSALTNEASDAEWDEFVAAHPDGHHEQSSLFGKTRADYGFQCDRIVVRDSGHIVGGIQVLTQRTPLGILALALRAPLALDSDPGLLSRVVELLDQLAGRNSYASVRIEVFPTQLAALAALERGGFHASTAWFGERPSLVIPLALSDSDVLAQMKSKGRYNIRIATKAGVEVRHADVTAMDELFALHESTATYQGFPVFPRAYFDYVWRVFGETGKMQLFIAYHGGKAIAAIFNTIVAGRMYYGWGGMDRDPAPRKLMANYLLHFTALKWAREHGCTHYDLVGVTEFKEKLARDEIHWPSPRRKYYGPLRALRGALVETSWSNPLLCRGVKSIGWRLGLMRRLPY